MLKSTLVIILMFIAIPIVYAETIHLNNVQSVEGKVIETNSGTDDAQTWLDQGSQYIQNGQYEEALVEFDKAIGINPNNAMAYRKRGDAYYSKGYNDYTRGAAHGVGDNYDKAAADYAKAISLNSNDVDNYLARGDFYAAEGQSEGAIADYTKAIDLNPNNAETYYRRGCVYETKGTWSDNKFFGEKSVYHSGNYDLAIADLNKAIELNSNYPQAYFSRAEAYYLKGEYEKAWDDLQKAESLGYKADTDFIGRVREAVDTHRRGVIIKRAIIFITTLVFLVIFYKSTYNTMIKTRNAVENAHAGIDVMLKRRHDLIPNLVAAVRQYMQYEQGILKDLTTLRTKALSLPERNVQKAAMEEQISSTLKGILVLAENYPQLKADEAFINLAKSLYETEEEIAAARRVYNGAVMQYNNTIQRFPNNCVAGLFGFSTKSSYEILVEEGKNVSVNGLLKP